MRVQDLDQKFFTQQRGQVTRQLLHVEPCRPRKVVDRKASHLATSARVIALHVPIIHEQTLVRRAFRIASLAVRCESSGVRFCRCRRVRAFPRARAPFWQDRNSFLQLRDNARLFPRTNRQRRIQHSCRHLPGNGLLEAAAEAASMALGLMRVNETVARRYRVANCDCTHRMLSTTFSEPKHRGDRSRRIWTHWIREAYKEAIL